MHVFSHRRLPCADTCLYVDSTFDVCPCINLRISVFWSDKKNNRISLKYSHYDVVLFYKHPIKHYSLEMKKKRGKEGERKRDKETETLR